MPSFKEIHPNIHATTCDSKSGEQNLKTTSAILGKIEEINKDPALINLIERCKQVVNGEKRYVEESCTLETKLQRKIVQDTHEDNHVNSWAHMLSGHVGGCFIKMIAEIVKAERIMEIGMFTGYSAVTFAETSHCKEMVCLEIDSDMEKFVRERIKGTPVEKKIRIVVGPAQDSLKKLKENGEKFDLVYIDANKDGYLGYYKYIMDNNLMNKSTGVILCDNILWSQTTVNQSTPQGKLLHEFVQYVKQDERVMQMVMPISDGVFMIKVKNDID